MSRIRLDLVISDFNHQLAQAQELVLMASQLPGIPNQQVIPPFKNRHIDQIVELAFFSGFLAWEKLIEESFTLYTLGKQAPGGYSPNLYISPTNRKHAIKFAKGDKNFPLWSDYDFVLDRSNHFFQGGRPYAPTLRLIRVQLQQMKIIRNSIAHSSTDTEEKFKTLVRNQLGHFPGTLRPGRFLVGFMPARIPAITYFKHYFETLSWAAERIIPS